MSAPVPAISEDIAVPSTPSREWADKTASSLSPEHFEPDPHGKEVNKNGVNAWGSTTSTPGYDFPGAYPRGLEEKEHFAMEDAKKAALDAYVTAKSYIPDQQDVEKVVMNAGETVRQYLPAAVTSYFPPTNTTSEKGQTNGINDQNRDYSLPSKEAPNESLGKTGGVGVLPGTNSETSVAKLPAERDLNIDDTSPTPAKVDTSFLTSRTNADIDRSGASDDLSNISTQAQDGSELSSVTSRGSTPMPTNGTRITPPSASGDTLGPRENVQDDSESTTDPQPKIGHQPTPEPVLNITPRTHPLGQEGTKWKGVPLSEAYQKKLDENPERQLNIGAGGEHTSFRPQDPYEISTVEKAKDEAYATKDKITGGTTERSSPPGRPTGVNTQADSTKADAGHSPMDRDEKDGNTIANVSFHPEATKAKADHIATSGTSIPTKGPGVNSGNGTGGSPHKSKFMDKIKGEVKVISGKLAHNEEKIEEGRRLMGKSI